MKAHNPSPSNSRVHNRTITLWAKLLKRLKYCAQFFTFSGTSLSSKDSRASVRPSSPGSPKCSALSRVFSRTDATTILTSRTLHSSRQALQWQESQSSGGVELFLVLQLFKLEVWASNLHLVWHFLSVLLMLSSQSCEDPSSPLLNTGWRVLKKGSSWGVVGDGRVRVSGSAPSHSLLYLLLLFYLYLLAFYSYFRFLSNTLYYCFNYSLSRSQETQFHLVFNMLYEG